MALIGTELAQGMMVKVRAIFLPRKSTFKRRAMIKPITVFAATARAVHTRANYNLPELRFSKHISKII